MMFLALALMTAMDAASPGHPDQVVEAMGPAVAELMARPEVTIVPYGVQGRRPRDIRRNMDLVRPSDPLGGRFDAMTTWQFSTRWGNAYGPCDPATSEARVGVKVQLPYLEEGQRLKPSDRLRWDRYFTALVGHEAYHVALAVQGADVMQDEMRLGKTCDDLAEISENRAEAVAEASDQYDALTDHGRKEGAVFP